MVHWKGDLNKRRPGVDEFCKSCVTIEIRGVQYWSSADCRGALHMALCRVAPCTMQDWDCAPRLISANSPYRLPHPRFEHPWTQNQEEGFRKISKNIQVFHLPYPGAPMPSPLPGTVPLGPPHPHQEKRFQARTACRVRHCLSTPPTSIGFSGNQPITNINRQGGRR